MPRRRGAQEAPLLTRSANTCMLSTGTCSSAGAPAETRLVWLCSFLPVSSLTNKRPVVGMATVASI